MFWEQISWERHEKINRNTPVIFNVGSIEQHGPALPVGVDSFIGWALCKELNNRIFDDVIILPQIKVAYSKHHMDFPGSLTVSHETLIAYMSEVIESVIDQGYKNILLLNTHGGNQGAMQVLMEKMGNRYQHVNIMSTTWWRLCGKELAQIAESGFMGNGHSGEFEFSLIMYLHDDLIDYSKKSPGAVADVGFSWAENDLLTGAKVGLYRSFKEMTVDGTYGLTKDASREKGERIFNLSVGKLMELVRDIQRLKERIDTRKLTE